MTDRLRQALGDLDDTIAAAAGDTAMTAGVVCGITSGMRKLEVEHAGDEEFLAPVREYIFQPRIDQRLAAGWAS